MSEYIVPTDARAEYKNFIQRANRRILANLKYIKEEGIKDKHIKTGLAGDYFKKSKWATKSAPLSYSTKFKSEREYRQFMRFAFKWGEDTGGRGGHQADPRIKLERGKEAIYQAMFGLSEKKGISLEKWRGDLPPEMVEKIESLSLEQISKFFDYVNEEGQETYFDSDQVNAGDIENMLDYLSGRLSEVQKFYPKASKKKKKSRRKTKGRKKTKKSKKRKK